MRNKEIYRNEIKSYIIRAGMTMSEAVEILADEYGWSSSVPNLSDKLKRGSLRYGEAVELADVLGYDIVCYNVNNRVRHASQACFSRTHA